MRALWRGFDWEMPIFCLRFHFLAGSSHAAWAFWTAGFTARPPDIGSVWCTKIFQVSNRTIVCILKRSARLYGDCMLEPDHMAKYSLPVLTNLTENLIQKKLTFYVLTRVKF